MTFCILITYPSLSAPGDAMLTMFVRATCWLSMYLYMLAHTSMHRSCLLVYCPWFNRMKLWIFDPNLHLSLADTTFLFAFLLVCLLACSLAFLFLCLPCISCLTALCLFHVLFSSFPPIACLLVSCLCLCMYAHSARTHGARARSPRHKWKGQGCEHVHISQVAMFSRFRGLVSPIWLCTLLNTLPSSLISLLNGLYWVFHAMYHLSSSLEYGDPCLLSFPYILGHALGMLAFTFLLCVLALCMMYIYIYLLAPSGMIVIVHVT